MRENQHRPLADRLRPASLENYIGQQHILAKDKPLFKSIESGRLHSMIFWGPPGTGKTTLARLIAHYSDAQFLSISAVLSGVKDIRNAIERAQLHYESLQKPSILFVDEVHRFNKSQQDAFLPHVENGTVSFIGATTENPSFQLNNALLSRCKTYVLKAIEVADIVILLQRALNEQAQHLHVKAIHISDNLLSMLAHTADGDARRALNLFEIATELADVVNDEIILTEDIISNVSAQTLRRFDSGGDYFYDQISAMHKSVRGSNPDAALYWMCRMLDGGCEPLYIARRIIRIASEDIGNADPRALQLSINAWESYQRLGSPEGELMLAQAIIYLACAPKSNAAYMAYKAAMQAAKQSGSLDVPLHLRNAPTKLMQELDYGKNYRYAHNEEQGFAAGEKYFPEELNEPQFYHPVDRGLEIKIADKLKNLRGLNKI